uniref:F-box domain-containing protein n=1 Tax=Meloidogyne enterolobii TaxID=390850 RepID=A0A6V7VPG6_MELEN|nr:unnamed protein product [Meloidogyne enterolobii]
MFYSLPTETKIDIFKFLNHEDLCSINETNLYFYDFINKYGGTLARERLNNFSINCIDQCKGFPHKLIRLNVDLPLNEELEKKFKNGFIEPIPLYLHDQDSNKNIVICFSKDFCSDFSKIKEYHQLQLPTIIKGKEDIKIVYYYLNKLFNCSFEYICIEDFIFNPNLIQLLFGNVKRFYVQNYNFSITGHNIQNLFQFIFKHLIGETLTIKFLPYRADIKKFKNILLKILTNGDNFNEAYLKLTYHTGRVGVVLASGRFGARTEKWYLGVT